MSIDLRHSVSDFIFANYQQWFEVSVSNQSIDNSIDFTGKMTVSITSQILVAYSTDLLQSFV